MSEVWADQLPRDYGGTVDFDILGTAWSEEDCERCVSSCRLALQQDVRERQSTENHCYSADKPWPRIQQLFVLSVLLLLALYGIP
ncbi:unnamed protein product [Symbiodinium pilosum]|uniref:Uncharacterized protein n=1 Tax=Symbiodinium pilosum TaxID=2952 RepID=A0A812RPQ9_SYMPI|nr:unnamed protein product [Symbiodinium pilosum]